MIFWIFVLDTVTVKSTCDKNYRPLHASQVGKNAKSAVYQIQYLFPLDYLVSLWNLFQTPWLAFFSLFCSQTRKMLCSCLQCCINAQILFQLFCFHSVCCQITSTCCTSLAFSLTERRKKPETAQRGRAQNSMSTFMLGPGNQTEWVRPAENSWNEDILSKIVFLWFLRHKCSL